VTKLRHEIEQLRSRLAAKSRSSPDHFHDDADDNIVEELKENAAKLKADQVGLLFALFHCINSRLYKSLLISRPLIWILYFLRSILRVGRTYKNGISHEDYSEYILMK
jgi:hypothetical protein